MFSFISNLIIQCEYDKSDYSEITSQISLLMPSLYDTKIIKTYE